jgi:hypothetical protein
MCSASGAAAGRRDEDPAPGQALRQQAAKYS